MIKVLDACCGGRMFWFDKQYENAVYIDVRLREKGHVDHKYNPNHEIVPDVIMDNRNLGFADTTFRLVVFDPPHIRRNEELGSITKKYGVLDYATWKYDLAQAFDECWRVLAENGTLIFKWSEIEIPHNEVLECFSEKPLFGTKYGNTIWSTFFKN